MGEGFVLRGPPHSLGIETSHKTVLKRQLRVGVKVDFSGILLTAFPNALNRLKPVELVFRGAESRQDLFCRGERPTRYGSAAN